MSTLLVSSVGGHLTQLHRLLPRLRGIDDERRWVTYDTPQSRSLLRGEDAVFLDYAGPREAKTLLRHAQTARRMLREERFQTAVSTGSGIALSFLPAAALRGASCHYIESFTRSDGPSLTGRLLRHVPGVAVYTQYASWARSPWRYGGSVFDAFAPLAPVGGEVEIRRAVVTLGTMRDYAFRRLVDRALAILPIDVEVLWQVGCTDVSDLPIDACHEIPAEVLQTAMREADVVIAHAGCGSALSALDAGKKPVLVARRESYGENVDDHQELLAGELAARDLAVVRTVEELDDGDLRLAARALVRPQPVVEPFELAG
jgi:UDP-N-acetylglucosamine transferase subunit ALG13